MCSGGQLSFPFLLANARSRFLGPRASQRGNVVARRTSQGRMVPELAQEAQGVSVNVPLASSQSFLI